ncbi:MAG: sulfatase, partial [Myxococcota bacterium]
EPVPSSRVEAPPADIPERVVLITVDTLRAEVLGTYGGPALTPEIDSWATRGQRFDRAFAAAMITNPSHASILTSLHPRDHGVYDNQSGIADPLRTLPSELRARGYATGAVVAFPHLNPEVANLGRGFDRFVPATRKERRAHEQVELTLSEIEALPSDRFFFWLHIGDPHAPYEPLGEPRTISPAKTPIRRATRVSPGFQRNNVWFRKVFKSIRHTEPFYDRYVAEVEAVDRALAALREGLAERGLWEKTLIVLTSDHGENFGENDLWFHHGGLHDSSVRVPLVIAGPGVQPEEREDLASHVDIAPTVLALLDSPRWEPMRGRELMGEGPPARYAFSEHMLAQAVSVRDGEWLAILHRKNSRQFPNYPFTVGTRELWRRNPNGVHLRVEAAAHPEVAERLEQALEEYLGAGPTLHARRALQQDRESLRALGYIE